MRRTLGAAALLVSSVTMACSAGPQDAPPPGGGLPDASASDGSPGAEAAASPDGAGMGPGTEGGAVAPEGGRADGGTTAGSDGGTQGPANYGALFFDDFLQSAPPVGPRGDATTWLTRFAFGGAEYLNGDGNVAYMCDPSPKGSNPGAIGYDPFSIGGSVLTIEAQSVASSGVSNPAGTAWNSGVITSCDEQNGAPAPGLFASAHGYFEVRAKWPKGGVAGTPGWWPAAVLYPLPLNGKYPSGEIDFPECLGGDTSRSEWTIHPGPGTNYYGPGPVDLGDGHFHTVGADVQPQSVDFYLDGTKIFSNTPDPSWSPDQQWYFNIPFEVSVVGSWGGGLPNVASPGGPDPAYFRLDYAGCWKDFPTRKAYGPARAPDSVQ